MNEDRLIFWIVAIGSVFGISLPTLLLLWNRVWKEKLILWWSAYRIRIARNVKKADYIRWWRSL
jgi:hypothetical protein